MIALLGIKYIVSHKQVTLCQDQFAEKTNLMLEN